MTPQRHSGGIQSAGNPEPRALENLDCRGNPGNNSLLESYMLEQIFTGTKAICS